MTGKKYGGRKAGSLNKATAEVRALAQAYTGETMRVLVARMRAKKSGE
jgi:hypothetical protein